MASYIGPVECAKCKGNMAQGFMAEIPVWGPGFGGLNGRAMWVEGKPETGPFGGIKVLKKARIVVKTFRCTKCGYLENYA